MNNDEALERLLQNTFDVTLAETGIALKCRDLPGITLSRILAALATSLRTAVVDARKQMAEAVIELADSATKEMTASDMENLMATFAPLVYSAAAELPNLVEVTLLDVIVDAKRAHVAALSTKYSAQILQEVFSRLDVADLAEKVYAAFFGLRKVSELVAESLRKIQESP